MEVEKAEEKTEGDEENVEEKTVVEVEKKVEDHRMHESGTQKHTDTDTHTTHRHRHRLTHKHKHTHTHAMMMMMMMMMKKMMRTTAHPPPAPHVHPAQTSPCQATPKTDTSRSPPRRSTSWMQERVGS